MSRRNAALLLVLSGIWGSSFLFIKLGVDELEPSVVALGRLVVGTAILLPLAAGRGGLGLLRPHLPVVATLGGDKAPGPEKTVLVELFTSQG